MLIAFYIGQAKLWLIYALVDQVAYKKHPSLFIKCELKKNLQIAITGNKFSQLHVIMVLVDI